MKEFMLIYRGCNPDWMKAPTEQRQATMAAWGKWMEELGARGQLVTGGSPLPYEGKRVAADGVITDIAASELKELVSGYSIVKAKDYDEAVQIARACPVLANQHSTVEVRPLAQL